MQLIFDHSQEIATNIRTFWFQPQQSFNFIAGQYIRLYLPHDQPDQRGCRRWFSVSASPTEKMLAITTKFSGPDSSTFKQTLCRLRSGHVVTVDPPLGDFVLPIQPEIPLLFVAFGVGVTPFRSIAKYLADTKEQRSIKFIYAVTSPAEVIFYELFEQVFDQTTLVVDNASSSWTGPTGSVTAKRVLDLGQPTENTLIYSSGPKSLITTIEREYQRLGIARHRLVSDLFAGY